jgi:transcriptional regulator with XRE-family HTH domain
MLSLGSRLRTLRTEAGLSQTQLAALLDYDHSAVARWENDGRSPSVATLALLADSYGVTLDWLLIGSTRQHRDGRVLIGGGHAA